MRIALVDEWINAQEMARKNKNIVKVPTEKKLSAIRAGCSVNISNKHERFFVLVTEVNNGLVYGIIQNKLLCTAPYDYGDLVVLEPQHVFMIDMNDSIESLTKNMHDYKL